MSREKIFQNENDNIELNYDGILLNSIKSFTNLQDSVQDSGENSGDSDNDSRPTESRIEFIKNILNSKSLVPMMDFDNCDTENLTKSRLNKKIIDVKEFFSSMKVKLRYLKSGSTGHVFKATSQEDEKISFAVKVCAYPRDDYGAMTNISRPENSELRIIKLLSYLVVKKCTPHIVLPIGTFNTSITNFINVPKNIIDISDKKNDNYRKFIRRYKKGQFEDFVSILISEWYDGGDLLDYIRKNYENMDAKKWTIIFFQFLFTLALIHEKFPAFRHNDLKANNILIKFTNIKKNPKKLYYRYNIDTTKFILPDIGMQIGISDYDFACIDGMIENNKVNSNWAKEKNITKKENKYYDMHYFFNTLISKRFFPQFYEGGAPQIIVDFIHRVVPVDYRNGGKYVNEQCRVQINHEYLTPYQVIMTDPLFEKYRFRDK